ncbi:MAG: thioesterase family protein [Kofleriaceae bacterium]
MIHEIRVIFGDTDQMGVVYYANYLRFFEAARAAFWRSLGKSYRDLEACGVALPVIAAHCEYRAPARYEDLLEVDVDLIELRHASMRFGYKVRCEGRLLAEGYTRHAVIDAKDGRPKVLPGSLREALDARPGASGSEVADTALRGS